MPGDIAETVEIVVMGSKDRAYYSAGAVDVVIQHTRQYQIQGIVVKLNGEHFRVSHDGNHQSWERVSEEQYEYDINYWYQFADPIGWPKG